jgi:phage gp37-like protein
MLALHENALVAALADHRDIKNKVKTVGSLPNVLSDKLLARYVADAPALYVVPGRITVKDDDATLEFTVAGIVRNVAGQAQARKGDGIDIGCDHLLTLAIRAINRQRLGDCSWSLATAEMADDDLFLQAGIAVIEMKFVSTPVELDADFGADQMSELDDFETFHADLDPAIGATLEVALNT